MVASTPFLSSGDIIADRRFAWAKDLEKKGDWAGAADLLEQVLERVPDYAAAWFSLGGLRETMGDRTGALAAFARALETDAQDRHGAALHLARLQSQVPDAMPRGYVRALFDHYAPAFERALTEGLQYRAPLLLRGAVERVCRRQNRQARFAATLDLGCGTGLSGEAFRPLSMTLTGVDLSGAMVARARRKRIYDRLEVGDIVEFLAAETINAARYDLVVAADVLIYFNDLAPIARACAAVLKPGGLFAFTAETYSGDDVILRETLRFAHGAAHLRKAVEAAGLSLPVMEEASIRTEKNIAVPGLLAVAQASTAP